MCFLRIEVRLGTLGSPHTPYKRELFQSSSSCCYCMHLYSNTRRITVNVIVLVSVHVGFESPLSMCICGMS